MTVTRSQLDLLPVGSQPVDTSEAAADFMFKSGKAAERRWLVLERLERSGPIHADGFLAEIGEMLGRDPSPNEFAPRFTELTSVGCAQYEKATVRTRSGKPAHRAAITDLGRAMLRTRRAMAREADATRRTTGTFFGPPLKGAA